MLLGYVVENPNTSTRAIVQEANAISTSSEFRILREDKYYPYHIEML